MVSGALTRFWHRILSSVKAQLPRWVRAMWLGEPLAKKVVFSDVEGGQLKTRAGFAIDRALLQDPPQKALSQHRKTLVDTYLPQEVFLKRDLSAPRAAAMNFRALARLDLSRRTPFEDGEVLWALSSEETVSDDVASTIQWVAKSAQLANIRKRLADLGLVTRQFLVEGVTTDQPIADYSDDVAPMGRMWRRLNGAILLGTLGLICAAWIGPAFRANQDIKGMGNTLAELREEALSLRLEVDNMRQQDTERATFLEAVHRSPKLSQFLRELTVALPDDTWVSDLRFASGSLRLTGETARPAAELVLALTEVRAFSNPRLSGPTQRTASGSERFELVADISADVR